MGILDTLLTELIETALPVDAEKYDENCNRDSFLLIANSARGSDVIPLSVKDKIVALAERLIRRFDTLGLNNWHAHNFFCVAISKLFIGFQRGEPEPSLDDLDPGSAMSVLEQAA